MEKRRIGEISILARGICSFGLRRCIDFNSVIEYIKRLGCKVYFYTDKEADKLNKKYDTLRIGADFRKIHAATNWSPDGEGNFETTVHFHRRKGRQSEEKMLHSALHELGHIVLNHCERLDKERELCEEEAELFYEAFKLLKQGKTISKKVVNSLYYG